MPAKSYSETLEWLFEQFPAYQFIGTAAFKPTLDNTNSLCSIYQHPEKKLKFIHVAGTNGKGSTSSMLASILTEAGEKVGLFTSPHIIDFRERIRVNGEMVSEQFVINFSNDIRSKNISFSPSFFEISFLMALNYFSESKCTVCVIETGLGGRLDATNVITPLLSIITNIGIEHTQFLGDTIEEIATEKAGIIKNDIPVIIGETTPTTKSIFTKIAHERKSNVIFSEEFPVSNKFTPPLLGDYQKRNLHTVLVACENLKHYFKGINDKTISSGLTNLTQNTGFFGRLQIVQKDPLVLFDVSHNKDGIEATIMAVSSLNKGQLHILYGSSADKDVNEIAELFPKEAKINFTTFSNTRSLSMQQLEVLNKKFNFSAKIYSNPPRALEEIQSIANKQDTILVFGSFFLLSDFF
ncbi:MAG: bifunctional folylpolyglutamate synthase/dihydrofolate synthase [Crocinitomicaceae bacterium]|jgi:dihydrofolate synthase / folylpolyglutamate synthase|nr:bifunctional folylpolyglutamate synthase/dihydrofolate synthase [Crocinitomicaceae bacterium]MDP5009950.1 bifunctional folylpolyglutamate synthase/dihydrofolate synthase [Crocinitomicaceae bacterium]MDP5099198.1 bifunctional folylpolyglutamate synthase/dihydrofolate synthase [Crocinitomicaceae bacterium]